MHASNERKSRDEGTSQVTMVAAQAGDQVSDVNRDANFRENSNTLGSDFVARRESLYKEAVAGFADVLSTLEIECHAVHKAHSKLKSAVGLDQGRIAACEALQVTFV